MTPTRKALCSLVVAVSIGATAAPSAPARPVEQFLGSDAGDPGSGSRAHIVRVAPESGFDWGDAEIGAGTALAVGLAGAGGALAIRKRRQGRLAATT